METLSNICGGRILLDSDIMMVMSRLWESRQRLVRLIQHLSLVLIFLFVMLFCFFSYMLFG